MLVSFYLAESQGRQVYLGKTEHGPMYRHMVSFLPECEVTSPTSSRVRSSMLILQTNSVVQYEKKKFIYDPR